MFSLLFRNLTLPSVTTAIFSTCGMNIFVFILAALLSMPKQFITVYLGVILRESATGKDNLNISLQWMAVDGISGLQVVNLNEVKLSATLLSLLRSSLQLLLCGTYFAWWTPSSHKLSMRGERHGKYYTLRTAYMTTHVAEQPSKTPTSWTLPVFKWRFLAFCWCLPSQCLWFGHTPQRSERQSLPAMGSTWKGRWICCWS